jgi:hypothetical protein
MASELARGSTCFKSPPVYQAVAPAATSHLLWIWGDFGRVDQSMDDLPVIFGGWAEGAKAID